ncbi:hypothetical protein [Amycolatopsis anabasis]|uniref:hypothetical protein n=1 Tax=Amycolatopsis anabasis TaxID=1840409 RepID=UPI00131BF067|nr:hypothetical protein [Amycolatopsis anabasis]
MLYIVLILVLAALGLLVTALITANSLWAWISIGLSVLAGLILVVDFLRRRTRRPGAEAEEAEPGAEEETDEDEAEPGEEPENQTELLPAAGKLDGEAKSGAETEDENGDPAEEQTDAADLLIVSELDVEVVVVDEYPRYHLTDCRWLADRDTIPIAIAEARELGFTPCAKCGPDAKLAAEYRANRKSPAE